MPERVVAFGPGRVNLIGEHTDYNDGLAMPFAIERGVTVTATPAAALRRRRARPRRARRVRRARARRAAGARSRAGWSPSCSAAGYDAAPGAPGDHRRPAARQRALVLGGARGRARARAARLADDAAGRPARRSPSSARASRTTGSAPRPACWTSSRRLLSQPGHALRIDFRSLDVEPHPLDLGDWQLVTRRLRRHALDRRAPATTSAAPSAARPARRSGSRSLRDAHATLDARSTARCSSAPATC